jgi:uncharacterized protein
MIRTLIRTLILATLLAATVCMASAQDIRGDWQGTLHAGADLHLLLHISKSANGALTATLDSIDQGANGIPVTSITLQGSKLSLGIDAVHGTYEGEVSRDGNLITGIWIQGQQLPLQFARATAPTKIAKPATPSDIDGAWMGTLEVSGGIKLRVIFRIFNTGEGLKATMDSPDQGMKGLPANSVTRDGTSLKIEAKQLDGIFQGKIAADRSSIEGTWTQHGGTFPLALKPLKDESVLELNRPQNPVKPYPYHEEEVSYENKAQKVTLAATLTIPAGKGSFPAVVLITGSGPQDRDESLLGHKPFLVLSDYLTRQGIAVLRADDRGTGKSTGNFSTATTADFATDTEAGIAFLKTRPEINSHKIGLIGHSEGGVIAPMIAARNPDVAFIVMMAGTGVPGHQLLVAQVRAIDEASGKSPKETEKAVQQERAVLDLLKTDTDTNTNKDGAALDKDLRLKLAGEVPEAQLSASIQQLTSPWFRYFIRYDPANTLRTVACPVLAINGERDTQVPPKLNLPAIRKALEAGGNKHFEVDELPGLNHLFQTSKTGAPSEYAQIEETISPVALLKISSWILQQ